jgi:catechol 2,3-dioxygenase-like lactoylglutathione lyase family enzyme
MITEDLMFSTTEAFSGMSSNDIAASRKFYEETLGVPVEDAGMGAITLQLDSGGVVYIYPKPDHTPAAYTVLNFPVDDIDSTVDELVAKGVKFEKYEGAHQDEKGVARGKAAGQGPDIAWFLDPAGNILSVLSN